MVQQKKDTGLVMFKFTYREHPAAIFIVWISTGEISRCCKGNVGAVWDVDTFII